jgi:uncharacterized paraquat-inducible protein A
VVEDGKNTDGAESEELPLILEPEPGDSQAAGSQQQTNVEEQLVGMNCTCGEIFLVPVALCGNVGVCPRCGAHVRLGEENFIRISCPCGMLFKVPNILSGRKGRCPQCRRQIKIPEKCEEATLLSRPQYSDTDEIFSDDLLDDVGDILLKNKGRTNRPVPEQIEKVPGQAEPPLKSAENLHVKMTCRCGCKLMIPLNVSHRQIKCPKCHSTVKLADDNFIRITCHCGMEFKVPLILEGKYGTCPKCHEKLKITKNK